MGVYSPQCLSSPAAMWQRSQCTASPPLPPLGSVPSGPWAGFLSKKGLHREGL